jgi:hypothetical protein
LRFPLVLNYLRHGAYFFAARARPLAGDAACVGGQWRKRVGRKGMGGACDTTSGRKRELVLWRISRAYDILSA